MNVDQVLQAESLLRLFESKDWSALLKIEEDLLNRFERDTLRKRADKSMEDYAKEHLILKGMRDAIISIWHERDRLIKGLKEQG